MADIKRMKRRKAERETEFKQIREASTEILKGMFGIVEDEKIDSESARLKIRAIWLEAETKAGRVIPYVRIVADSLEDVISWGGGVGYEARREMFFEDVQ